MELIRNLENVNRESVRYVAVGVFDGVHRGHQVIINQLVDLARKEGALSTVLTFEPHPLDVLMPGQSPPCLTTVEEKASIVENMGVDTLIVLPFTRELAAMPPQTFIEDVLVKGLNSRRVLVGFNFTFGDRGLGTPDTLRQRAGRYGYEVDVFEPVTVDGLTVSSSLIRGLILEGQVAEAAALLGRNYSLKGRVVRGDGRGRLLGFPTANIELPPKKVLPSNGVYAVTVLFKTTDLKEALTGGAEPVEQSHPPGQLNHLNETVRKGAARVLPGVANIGRRPTFKGEDLTLEVFILDFSQNLYGEVLEVEFVSKIRDETTFPGPEQLREQIESDVRRAREIIYNARVDVIK